MKVILPFQFLITLACAMVACSSSNSQIDNASLLHENDSLVTLSKMLADKIDSVYLQLNKDTTINSTDSMNPILRIDSARLYSNELIGLIETIKIKIISLGLRIPIEEASAIDLQEIKMSGNKKVPREYLLGPGSDYNTGEASRLKSTIKQYEKLMILVVEKSERVGLEKNTFINIEGPFYDKDQNPQCWEAYCFEGKTLLESLLVLNRIIYQIRVIENEVIQINAKVKKN